MKVEKQKIGKDQDSVEIKKYLITEIYNVIYVFFRNLKMEENTVTSINQQLMLSIHEDVG